MQAKPKKPVIVEVSDTDTSEEESIGRRGIRVEKNKLIISPV
jgi:hypothetical protein